MGSGRHRGLRWTGPDDGLRGGSLCAKKGPGFPGDHREGRDKASRRGRDDPKTRVVVEEHRVRGGGGRRANGRDSVADLLEVFTWRGLGQD